MEWNHKTTLDLKLMCIMRQTAILLTHRKGKDLHALYKYFHQGKLISFILFSSDVLI